jgi:hypothetical protein
VRTYGRAHTPNGTLTWQVVQTDPTTGLNDLVYVTTLCQVLLLNLGESPFSSQMGIPAQQSILQQIMPDYYVALTQQNFAPYFASLLISRTNTNPPTYQVNITTHQGLKINASVPIPY